jgi:hypothetical protein
MFGEGAREQMKMASNKVAASRQVTVVSRQRTDIAEQKRRA